MKPRMVDSTTTAMVHTRVFFRTKEKAGALTTLMKFSKLLKPLSAPVLVTLFRAIRNTVTMGIRMKTAIRMTLGAIQM